MITHQAVGNRIGGFFNKETGDLEFEGQEMVKRQRVDKFRNRRFPEGIDFVRIDLTNVHWEAHENR